jgi:hypothetical protein
LPEKIFFQSLRKDQHAVRTDVKRAVGGEAVALARFGEHVAAPMAFEVAAVTLPIAVETKRLVWLCGIVPRGALALGCFEAQFVLDRAHAIDRARQHCCL